MIHHDLLVKLLLDIYNVCVCARSVCKTLNKRERDEGCVLNESVSLLQKELDQQDKSTVLGKFEENDL